MEINEENLGKGGIIQPRDEMIASFSEVVADSPTFDWDKGFDIRQKLGHDLSLKDQNGSGSCGGQASSYLTEAIYAINAIEDDEFSAHSIYSQCFILPAGSSETGLINTILNKGVAKEKDVPSYENGNPPSEIFMQANYIDGPKTLKGLRPVYINTDFDSIATAVLQNGGVVIGIGGENNGTWLTNSPVKPNLPPHDVSLWNHWVYVGFVGIRNSKRVLGFKNSWGNVGENGWQYITEDYLPYIWCAWSMIYNTQEKPKYTFTIPMLYGQSSKDIKVLQDCLRYEGLFNNASTGYYGPLSSQAVMAFQRKYQVASESEIVSLQGKRCGSKTINQLNLIFN